MPLAHYSKTAVSFAPDPSSTHQTTLSGAEPSTPDAAPVEVARAEQAALLRVVMATSTHFFGPLSSFLSRVSDPRDPAQITYPLPVLLFTGLLIFTLPTGSAPPGHAPAASGCVECQLSCPVWRRHRPTWRHLE